MAYMDLMSIRKQYGEGEVAVWAVKGITCAIEKGEWIAIMGESGSGKSTLLSIMGALNAPSGGSYRVDKIEVYSMGQEERADFRRAYLGFVFQNFHLVPYLTVIENVILPLAPTPLKRMEKLAKAEEALWRVGLRGKENRLPNQISGGEQERVAIARAIVNTPPILLADEPTGNLDSHTTEEIMKLLNELNTEGNTILIITHEHDVAARARNTIRLADGRIVA